MTILYEMSIEQKLRDQSEEASHENMSIMKQLVLEKSKNDSLLHENERLRLKIVNIQNGFIDKEEK